MGANGLSRYLENHGIHKIQRHTGTAPLFNAWLIRQILKNPVYCGKIAYGRRKTEKVHGTRNEYQIRWNDDYLLVDGIHEAIVSEEVWQAAQVKLAAQADKYESVNPPEGTHVHILSGLIKCPVCGAGMYGNKSTKRKKDGTKYKEFYYYACKHRRMTRGHKCDYKKQLPGELIDKAVAEIIIDLVSKPRFAAMMQEKINRKVDTTELDQEIATLEKQLRQSQATKARLIDEIDSLDPDDRHYTQRKKDLDERLYRMYDKIEETERLLIDAKAKKKTIEEDKLTGDNIYRVLMCFSKLYNAMNDEERRDLMQALIGEIHIHEEPQENGQWLKAIRFRLPVISEDISTCLDIQNGIESVVCLSREKADDYRKESKMISDEKSAYKSWSNLKKQMNNLLCDSLKGKISYFYTSYHEVHNAYGRATIQYEKKEIVAFSWDRQYEQVQDIKEQYKKMNNVPSMLVDYEGSLNAYKVANIAATKEKWMPNCTLCETDFLNSLTIYLKTDIATSLRSDNYLLRVFAYMDRRVGKRTLIKIKDDVENLPDWVKQFYRIRCEADGIIFPPKRITDETVVCLTRK